MEIGIRLLIFILPLLFVIGIPMLLRDLFSRSDVDEEQVETLERRVRELEQQPERIDEKSDSA
ncbi:MAG: hypothetical protein KGY43_03655 [Halodesulfurarchaeum sp.]|nr:hypothetical protein [Halodesulfurarchaeum sp.]